MSTQKTLAPLKRKATRDHVAPMIGKARPGQAVPTACTKCKQVFPSAAAAATHQAGHARMSPPPHKPKKGAV